MELRTLLLPTGDPAAWRALIDAQDGLVTRVQVLAQGLTYETIRANIAARRWQRVGHGVFATFTGPLTEAARRRAAVLEHWPCALSHRTAGEIWHFCDPDPDAPIHVVVPFGSSAVSSPRVVVHRGRAFAYIPIDRMDPPVVARAHTAVDLAVAEDSAQAAMRRMLHCLVVTRLRPIDVQEAMALRRPRRYLRALEDALRYATEGVTSALEALYALDVEDAHGLPRGTRQVPVLVDEVRRFEDVGYHVGERLAIVRLDGRRHHADESTTVLDRRRDTAAALAGHARIVVGWFETRHHACRTAREVGELLSGIGWDGALRACARCVGP